MDLKTITLCYIKKCFSDQNNIEYKKKMKRQMKFTFCRYIKDKQGEYLW